MSNVYHGLTWNFPHVDPLLSPGPSTETELEPIYEGTFYCTMFINWNRPFSVSKRILQNTGDSSCNRPDFSNTMYGERTGSCHPPVVT